MVGISRMFRNHRPLPGLRPRRRPRRRRPEAAARARRRAARPHRHVASRASGEHDRARSRARDAEGNRRPPPQGARAAGLVRVVRTRQVRAMTEKFYGRVARLFVLKGDESVPEELARRRARRDDAAPGGRRARSPSATRGHVRPASTSGSTAAKRRRFEQRLNRLVADFQRADDPEGASHALAYALFRAPTPLPPRGDDA